MTKTLTKLRNVYRFLASLADLPNVVSTDARWDISIKIEIRVGRVDSMLQVTVVFTELKLKENSKHC